MVDTYEDSFIIKLAGSSSKGGNGRIHMTVEGVRPIKGNISKVSLSKGRGSGSFLTSHVKKGNFGSSGVGGSQSNINSICAKNEDFLIFLQKMGADR